MLIVVGKWMLVIIGHYFQIHLKSVSDGSTTDSQHAVDFIFSYSLLTPFKINLSFAVPKSSWCFLTYLKSQTFRGEIIKADKNNLTVWLIYNV